MEDEPKDVRTPQDEPKKDEAKFTREDLAKLVSEQAHKRQLNRMLNGTRNLMRRQLRKLVKQHLINVLLRLNVANG